MVVYLVFQYGERSATASISLLGPCSWRRSVFSSLVMCSLSSANDVLQRGRIKWMECVHLREMFGDENTLEWKSSTLDIRRRHFGSHGSPRRRRRGRTSGRAEEPPKCDGMMLCGAEISAGSTDRGGKRDEARERRAASRPPIPRIRPRLPSQERNAGSLFPLFASVPPSPSPPAAAQGLRSPRRPAWSVDGACEGRGERGFLCVLGKISPGEKVAILCVLRHHGGGSEAARPRCSLGPPFALFALFVDGELVVEGWGRGVLQGFLGI